MPQLLTQTCTAVINIANNSLEAGKSNKIIDSRVPLVIKAADLITIMGKLNTMFTNERKTRFFQKPALPQIYYSLCDQDFSQSVYLVGDDLPEELRKAESQHFLGTIISKRKKNWVSIN